MNFKPLALTLLLLAGRPAMAAADYTTLVVKPGQGVREIARDYLGDPELWKEILENNGLTSPVQIQPGMSLHIPSRQVVEANRTIDTLQEKVNEAIRLSARVFAEGEISRAVTLRDQALAKRRARDWESALGLAREALALAEEAIKVCRDKIDQKAEARLVDVAGSVQVRPPSNPLWKGITLFSTLTEGDRIRTLANSSAEVQFRDESRLRLDENSQVLIQRMRSNLLENREQASVSVLEGDVFALLGDNQKRNAFDLEVPGVDLKGSSRNFYVNRAKDGTRFANYEGELEVDGGEAGNVTLQSNEGVALGQDGLSEVKKLLPTPRLLAPAVGSNLYQSEVTFTWEVVKGATNYWFELSPDRAFTTTLVSVKRVTSPNFTATGLTEGSYFWRVSAVDKDDFPGPRSEPFEVKLLRDTTPPYVLLRTPEAGAVLLQPKVTLEGVVELGGVVRIEGQPVKVSEEGDFRLELSLKPGDNAIKVEAQDPAGNVTEVVRQVRYRVPEAVTMTLSAAIPRDSDKALLTPGERLLLSGSAQGGAEVVVLRGEQAVARTLADDKGAFDLLVTLLKGEETFTVRITSVAGETQRFPVTVRQDSIAPSLQLEALPERTAEEQLVLRGSVDENAQLTLNEGPVTVNKGKFSHTLTLRPGINRLELLARDRVGNTSVTRRTLLLDRSAPQLLRKRVERKVVEGRNLIEIEIGVGDASPLRATAPFTLKAGDFSYTGMLKLIAARGEYVGSVYLPVGNGERAELIDVTLTDQLGNERSYNP